MVLEQTTGGVVCSCNERNSEGFAYHTADSPCSGPLHIELEILPRESGVQADYVLRVVSESELAGHIVAVNVSVVVKIHEYGVTVLEVNKLLGERLSESLFVEARRVGVVETEELVHISGADTVALLVLIIVGIGGFLALDDTVLVVRQVHISPVVEVFAYPVPPLQGCFPSPAVNDTQVGVRYLESDEGGSGHILQKDVCTVLLVVVEGQGQLLVQEVGIKSVVLLESLFPRYVGVVA